MVWRIFSEKKKKTGFRGKWKMYLISLYAFANLKSLTVDLTGWMHFHSKMVVDLKGYRRLSVAESQQRGCWELAVSQASRSNSVTEIPPIQLPSLPAVGEREVFPGFTYLFLLVRQITGGSYTSTAGHMTWLSQ